MQGSQTDIQTVADFENTFDGSGPTCPTSSGEASTTHMACNLLHQVEVDQGGGHCVCIEEGGRVAGLDVNQRRLHLVKFVLDNTLCHILCMHSIYIKSLVC